MNFHGKVRRLVPDQRTSTRSLHICVHSYLVKFTKYRHTNTWVITYQFPDRVLVP